MWLHTLAAAGLSLVFSPAFMILPAATIVYYNFHKFSYRLDSFRPVSIWKTVMGPSVRLTDRAMFVVGGIVILIGLFKSSPALVAAWTAAAFCALVYTFPLIRFSNRFRRLREMPLLKMTTVSVVWALTTAVFPLLVAESNLPISAPFFYKFAIVFALCVPFEIRDQKRELARELPTVMQFGRKRVIGAAIVLLMIATMMQLSSFLDGRLSLNTFMSFFIPGLMSAVLMIITRPDWPGWYFKLVVDGTMLLPFLILILA
ncbi:MAG: hypothetical protein RL021_1505 [Bacteroidota bacterium]